MELESFAAAMAVDSCSSSDSPTGMEMMDAPASAASVTTVGSLVPGPEDVTNEGLEVRRWRCAFCPALAAGPAMLRRHYAEAHPDERPFACELCSERFQDCASLAAHRAEHARLLELHHKQEEHGRQDQQQDQQGQLQDLGSADGQQARPVHTCDSFPETFCRRSDLRVHLKTHATGKRYECNLCSTSFKHRSNLRSHLRVHKEGKPYECNLCFKHFRDRYNLERHLRVHQRDKPYQYHVSQKELQERSSLKAHSSIRTNEKPYECNLCLKWFSVASRLRQHSIVHSGDKPFGCTVCPLRFNRRDNLNRHLRTRHGSQNPVTREDTASAERFRDRAEIVTEQPPVVAPAIGEAETKPASPDLLATCEAEKRPFRCTVCGRICSGRGTLEQHLLEHIGRMCSGGDVHFEDNNSAKEKNQGQASTETLSSTSASAGHLHGHSGAARFKCSRCPKDFRFRGDLYRHTRTHTGMKPFKCPECERTFARKDVRDLHLNNVHTGDRALECSICEKKFTCRVYLKRHLRWVHFGLRPTSRGARVKCSRCPKDFGSRRDLQRHTRTHTGMKPFKCTECEKTFSRKDVRDLHLKNVHSGDRAFECSVCGKKFTSREYLDKHLHRNHVLRTPSRSS